MGEELLHLERHRWPTQQLAVTERSLRASCARSSAHPFLTFPAPVHVTPSAPFPWGCRLRPERNLHRSKWSKFVQKVS